MCTLFDLGCHLQSWVWDWWQGIGLLNQALIAGGLIAMILGMSWGFLSLVKAIGGWPAVAGFIAVVVGFVLAILPKKPTAAKPRPTKPRPAPGVPRPRRKRETIFDVFRRR